MVSQYPPYNWFSKAELGKDQPPENTALVPSETFDEKLNCWYKWVGVADPKDANPAPNPTPNPNVRCWIVYIYFNINLTRSDGVKTSQTIPFDNIKSTVSVSCWRVKWSSFKANTTTLILTVLGTLFTLISVHYYVRNFFQWKFQTEATRYSHFQNFRFFIKNFLLTVSDTKRVVTSKDFMIRLCKLT